MSFGVLIALSPAFGIVGPALGVFDGKSLSVEKIVILIP
jgi:hypothetical protein